MSGTARTTGSVVPPVTASPAEAAQDLFQLTRQGVGASTGYMAEARGDWPRLVRQASQFSQAAVELSALSAHELPALTSFLAQAGDLAFGYVSVHAPAKGWKGDRAALALELQQGVPEYVGGIVVHPETLGDPAAFRILGRRLLLENMDLRKHDARTVVELQPYFSQLPEAGFCFDIAHAFSIDPTLGLAHDLLDAFGSRLREVHLSSLLDDGTHSPLATEDVRLFWPVLERCRDAPWILEAPVPAA